MDRELRKLTTEEKLDEIREILGGGIRDGKAFEGFLHVVERHTDVLSELGTSVHALNARMDAYDRQQTYRKGWLAGVVFVSGIMGSIATLLVKHFLKI